MHNFSKCNRVPGIPIAVISSVRIWTGTSVLGNVFRVTALEVRTSSSILPPNVLAIVVVYVDKSTVVRQCIQGFKPSC
jgi:hypothetical protein